MKNLFKNNLFKIFCYIYLCVFTFNSIVLADTSNMDCTTYGDLLKDLQNVFDFIKIVVPLLVIGLSTFDFIKAITNKDDKDIKKSFYRLMKRLALAVVFFFLPVLLNLLLSFIIEDISVCLN